MPRKGENIRKRKDGRWEARYIKGRNPDGSIRYGYAYGKKYLEVKEKRNSALRSLEKERSRNSADYYMKIGDLFDEWKKEVRHTVKESSFFYYDTLIEHHLRPCFGSLYIEELSSQQMQDFVNAKIKEGLSVTYIRSIMTLFQNILKTARPHGKPPLTLPAYTMPRSHQTAPDLFSYQEWNDLRAKLLQADDDFSFGLLLCMHTGIRIGELSGLKWEDFDIDNMEFQIRRTIYRMKNPEYGQIPDSPKTIVCIETPKTPSSMREIPIPRCLLPHIEKHPRTPGTFVLTGSEHYMEPRNIQKKYRLLLAKFHIRYLNFHSLRHSFATISIQKGSDHKTVAELLGHASVNTTLNIYVHSSIDQKRRCLELLTK